MFDSHISKQSTRQTSQFNAHDLAKANPYFIEILGTRGKMSLDVFLYLNQI